MAGLLCIRGKGLTVLDINNESSRRVVSMPREVVDRLRQVKVHQMELALQLGTAFHEDGVVFCLADGMPLSPEGVSHELHRLMQAAGLTGIRLHDLRHTMASLKLADESPINLVQERLGHSTPMTTLGVYGHVLPGGTR